MTKINDLKQRKNDMIDELIDQTSQAAKEQRSLTISEQKRKNYLEKEIAKLDKMIADEQQYIRANSICENSDNSNQGGRKNMTEFRSMINRDGRVDLTEVRANVVTNVEGNHQQVQVPGRFVEKVYMDAVHNNFLLSLCETFQTEENNRILVAERLGKMTKLNEMDEIQDSNFVTVEHALQPERYGVANTVSRHLLAVQGFDVAEHVSRLFSQSLSETLEMLVAQELDKEHVGMPEVVFTDEPKDVDLLTEIVKQLAVQPESLRANSVIVMNPTHYQQMIIQKDGVGRNILDFSFDQSLRAKVCGVPVVVSAEVQHVYVGSLRDAVVCGVNIAQFESEQKPRANAVSFYMNVYAAAIVKQPGAMTRIKFN